VSTPALLQAIAGQLGPDHSLSGLPSGALGWALARAAEGVCAGPKARPLMVCAGSRDEADRLLLELRFHLGGKGPPVLRLPADDSRPWDGVSPHPDIPRERLAALDALGEGRPVVVVAPGRALLQRVLPRATLRALRLRLRRGDIIERDALIGKLIERGYLMVQRVEEPGCVSRQGSVIDLWPTGAPHLLRVELFDDEVESVHALDPQTRRSLGKLQEVSILPAREAVVGPEALRRAAAQTLGVVEAGAGGHLVRQRVLADLQRGLWFPAAEDYLCALYALCSPIEVAAEGGALVVIAEPAELASELERADRVANERWRSLEPLERPVVSPTERFARPEQVEAELRAARCPRLGGMVAEGSAPAALFDARENTELRVGKGELAPVIGKLQTWLDAGWQMAVVVDSQSGLERLRAMFQPHGLRLHPKAVGEYAAEGQLAAWVGALDRGFHAPESQLAVIAADEIFGAKARAVPQSNKGRGQTLGSSGLAQLRAGDLVVHVRHGIGKFIGLRRLSLPIGGEEIEQDMVELEYRGGDRMYLPVTRLDRLQPYRATGGAPPTLDKLGGQTWDRRKSKARDRIAGMANEILRIHALREVVKGEAYEGLPEVYLRFEQAFAWNETPDQERAIADVLADLASERPMDRLIIGDVGFGKTEVALRAAMRVILEGKQAALLCPTTVLAFQHYKNAVERFEPFGIKVALHSSFRTTQQLRETTKAVESGEVALVVGTTGLLGRGVHWKDLALVIVDEEHRFGVKQKERLKKLARGRDGRPSEYLAMSATPIPRTLHMAISGLRDLSVIRTPPEGRRPVQTRVLKWNEATIRSEILHELKRGGQVFFVHNRIESIEVVYRRLSELVPEARLLVAHGQMEPEDLERTLVQFVQGEANVLLCTTIVESGVDMPNVNTILVNRADQLGLAQLYQLRGRVGRGSVRGYCSLIVPEDDAALQKDAMERLRVLQENQELGSGLMIAEADLELRGSGDLLGESQHGAIHELGLDTYVEMLDAAVAHARGDLARERLDPEVEVPVRALLPESYIEDLDRRLGEYRRLSATRSVPELRDLLSSWEDEYGAPPEEVLNLGWLTETRLRCRGLGIERIAWLKVRLLIDLHATTTIQEQQLAQLIRRDPQRFRRSDAAHKGVADADPGRRLEVRFSAEEGAHPFRLLHWVLASLERPAEDAPPAVIIDHDRGTEQRLHGRAPQDGPVRRIVRRPR
jgi:transcription-repair coupling factor (superfamily II helicase)